MPLTQTQHERFRQDGYIVIERLLSPAEVEAAKAAIADVIARRLVPLDIEKARRAEFDASTPAEQEMFVRKIMGFAAVEPRLKALSEHPALIGVIEELLGEAATMTQDMALLKPPFVGVEKPWHQDNAYFLIEPLEKVVGSWIALDRATVDNGCMQVIPGTHKLGPVPHYHIRDCQIPDERVDTARKVCVPLEPGGALIFSSLLHHGTPTNTSPDRRRALQFHYAAKSCRRITVEEQARLFQEDGKPRGCAAVPVERAMVAAPD